MSGDDFLTWVDDLDAWRWSVGGVRAPLDSIATFLGERPGYRLLRDVGSARISEAAMASIFLLSDDSEWTLIYDRVGTDGVSNLRSLAADLSSGLAAEAMVFEANEVTDTAQLAWLCSGAEVEQLMWERGSAPNGLRTSLKSRGVSLPKVAVGWENGAAWLELRFASEWTGKANFLATRPYQRAGLTRAVSDAVMSPTPRSLKFVTDLIRDGADLEERTMGSASPLERACQGRHSDIKIRIVDLLIAAGANPDPRNQFGHLVVLLTVARGGSAPALARLIAAGADLEFAEGEFETMGYRGLAQAVRFGHFACVQVFVAAGVHPVGRKVSALDEAEKWKQPKIRAFLQRALDQGLIGRLRGNPAGLVAYADDLVRAGPSVDNEDKAKRGAAAKAAKPKSFSPKSTSVANETEAGKKKKKKKNAVIKAGKKARVANPKA